MEEQLPEVFAQFKTTVDTLENHYRDVQDVEFTVEQGKLYMLQTRNAKRTSKAALKIAVDMAKEGLITPAGSADARRSGQPRSIVAPDARPQGREDRHRQGSAGIAGCGLGQDRLHRR